MRNLALLLLVLGVANWAGAESFYLSLGQACDPRKTHDGPATRSGTVCFPGSNCNAQTRTCDCADSDDGEWKRTFEDGQCKLLPGSRCVLNVEQDFYNCVQNAKCTLVRVGKDDPRKCPADAPCDTGDSACLCDKGKKCLDYVVPAPAAASS